MRDRPGAVVIDCLIGRFFCFLGEPFDEPSFPVFTGSRAPKAEPTLSGPPECARPAMYQSAVWVKWQVKKYG